MSEKAPAASERPKPKPPTAEHWSGPLKTVFGTPPEAAPLDTSAFAVPEDAESALDRQLAAVESTPVEDPAEVAAAEPVIESPAIVEAALIDAKPVETKASDVDTLEALFAGPSAPDSVPFSQPDATAVEATAVEAKPSEAPSEMQHEAEEEPVFKFVDKRNSASQEWSKENSHPTAQSSEVSPEVGVPAQEAEKPKRGELTHHDYHAQRPADGSIYRAGRTFQRAPGGEQPAGFVKNGKEEYAKQNGAEDPNSASKHYDEVTGLNEAQEATSERPSYETMDTDQLMFAYAKADMIGDKFVTDDIRNVYTVAMEEAYTKPGSPITYEEHMAALDRFDRLAEAAINYERAKDPDHYALVDAAVERANKEPSIGEKLKKWWGKNSESILNKFRPSYWAERWTNAVAPKIGETAGKVGDWAVNLRVNEDDTPEQAEKKRRQNRVAWMAGGAAVAVAGLAAASFGIGFGLGSNSGHHAAEALGHGGLGGGSGAGAGNTLSPHDQAIADALTPHAGGNAAEAAKHIQSAAEVIPSQFTIQPGNEGGEQLLTSLGIDPTKWYAHQDHLLSISEGHLYRMSDGNVGLRPGLLPQAVREEILGLK